MLIFLICWFPPVYSQGETPEDIYGKISENQVLFQTDPAQALERTAELLKEAIRLKNTDAELLILSKKYEYSYFLKIDFEQMLASARELQKKAHLYKDYLYEGMAYKYMAQVYHFNELYDKAFEQLQKAEKALESADENNYMVILEKGRIHTMKANTHSLKGEHFNAIQSLFSSLNEHKKLENTEIKRGAMFMDYANLGGAYLYINLDSSEHYARKSLNKMNTREENHNLTFLNYIVLGNIYKARKDYQNALLYYKKAENISENKHFVNIEQLYNNMISVYDSLGEDGLKNQYEHKLKDLKLQVARSQNKSLQKIVKEGNRPEEDKESNKSDNNKYLYIVLIASVIVIGMVIYLIRARRPEQDKDTITLEADSYNELITLLKNNEATFLLTFEKYCPDFSNKILKINPELTTIELELLAMLKLKLSTKEIAKYKFLQPKTVNNRRHIIRKKLHLPSDTDLYKWVETV